MSLSLDSSLLDIRGVGPRFFPKLKKLGIYTVGDLVYHFPARYEDYSRIFKIADLEPEQFATVQGIIENVETKHTWRRNLSITEATITDETGSIRARWFNQIYLRTSLREGKLFNFSGKIVLSQDHELVLQQPSYEVPGEVSKHTARLVPIYPETKGLTSRGIRFLMQPIIKSLTLKDWLPRETLAAHRLPDLVHALRKVHFPDTLEEALAAKKRFAFEDLFLLQLVNIGQKLRMAKEKSPEIPTDIDWLKQILAKLPFELTASQKKSLWEIIKDISHPHPMNRLLQGDVGSGKTVVAAIAAVLAARHGYQTAFLAPTEVLARQHFETLKTLFRGISAHIQPQVGLLLSGTNKIFYENDLETETTKESLKRELEKGALSIVVGTHALIQKNVIFNKLGLVIVDEQHRFGVEQRAALLRHRTKYHHDAKKHNNNDHDDDIKSHSSLSPSSSWFIPHLLSMSATPIPRTLMLTVFGDLDISIINELPAGRKEIKTKIVLPAERNTTYNFIRAKIREGRQAFVICPRIEIKTEMTRGKNGETLTIKSVKEEYERLSKEIFPDLKVGMLHGQMKPQEKDRVMKSFSSGKTDVLISTTVVEVGVDVPNAAIMMIEGSERFGLAQLYQLRGRVGRGVHESFCFLFTERDAASANARLQALLMAKNGFELAEYDLKLRGPGQFFGEEQTGLPDIAMQNLANAELVQETREAARELILNDPSITRHPSLKKRLAQFTSRLHLE